MFFYYANEESDNVINCSAKRVTYGSKNISGNVSAMVFKLGTSALQKKQNVICAVFMTMFLLLVLCQLKLKFPVFVLIKDHPLPTIEELRQYGNHVCFKKDFLSHFKGLQMGISGFWQKDTVAKSIVPAIDTNDVILFLLWCTFLVPSLRTFAQIFLEIFLIQYFTVLVEQFMTSSSLSFPQYKNVNISKTKKR